MGDYSKTTQEIIDSVKCPYQVFPAGGSSESVNAAYRAAVVRGRAEGFVPILVVSDDTLSEWLGILKDDSYSKDAVLKQEEWNGEEILKENFARYAEDFAEDFGEEGSTADDIMEELMGEMEGGETIDELSAFTSYSGSGIEETILFEIPVTNPWEVIAWMPMGGWNECPDASDMIRVCRYWYETYGALPAAFSHDVLEFYLEKPVEDEDTAWKLAKEHYSFCPDRVDQGTESGMIGEVADCIKGSSVWFFWWD